MAWFGNDYECGSIAQRIINDTDKIDLEPPKKYIYLVYKGKYTFKGAYGSKASATKAVRDIAFHDCLFDLETPLDFNNKDCWGWVGIAGWNRVEVMD